MSQEPIIPPVLRRYTTLSAVIDALINRRLALLDPKKWEDQTDASFLKRYRKSTGRNGLRAACLTASTETYHHWRVYAPGEGACLILKGPALQEAIVNANFEGRMVRYAGNIGYTTQPAKVEEFPFIKRVGYRDEQEFRIIGHARRKGPLYLSLTPDILASVALSPWTPPELASSVTRCLNGLEGWGSLHVAKSKLVYDESFNRLAENLAIDET